MDLVSGIIHNKPEYDEEPVYYCQRCLSLKIKGVLGFDELCYCDDCGSTDVETTGIHEWENLYKQKYNKKFINYGREQ